MKHALFGAAIGAAIGSAVTWGLLAASRTDAAPRASTTVQAVSASAIRYPIKATLYRFEMQPGAKQTFDKWMQWHTDEYPAIIETLEREKMYSEAIFTDSIKQPGVLYWLTIDGEGGASVDNSPHPIDSVHNQFMKAVIRKGSRSTLTTEYLLTPTFLTQSIAAHQSAEK